MTTREDALAVLKRALEKKNDALCLYHLTCALLASKELWAEQVAEIVGLELLAIEIIAAKENLPITFAPNIPRLIQNRLNLLDGKEWETALAKATKDDEKEKEEQQQTLSRDTKRKLLERLGLLNGNDNVEDAVCERIWEQLQTRIEESEETPA